MQGAEPPQNRPGITGDSAQIALPAPHPRLQLDADWPRIPARPVVSGMISLFFTDKLTARSGIRITLMKGLLAIAAATASSKLAVPWAVRWLAFLLGCPVDACGRGGWGGAGGPAAAVPAPARSGPVFASPASAGGPSRFRSVSAGAEARPW